MKFKALLICAGVLTLSAVAAGEDIGHARSQPPAAPEAATPSSSQVQELQREPGYAVRIAIDTSGSMKRTDPRNLRVPALKLLVNLLPAGSEAGVWLFDSRPQELVPAAAVDAAWKDKATRSASRIHSKGAFTDIEAALSAATSGWPPPATPGQRRRLILLTDGMVDVSKDPGESAASRDAIQNRVLPALQQAGIEIHTVALSDQADEELLRQLALSTGGWNAVAKDAEQLQRAFLQMFNQSIPHDSLPIRDNRFTVDSGVEEFTLLVLLQAGAAPTRLTAPDGHAVTQNSQAEHLRWLHEATFDLVTIGNPLPGEWRLEAKQDPANQVLVVSDLRMEPAGILNYLDVGDKPAVGAVFKDKDQPISREDFLGLLNVKAVLDGPSGTREFTLARAPEQPGAFYADVGKVWTPGEYALTVSADGRTFQRQTRQVFKVMADLLRVEKRVREDATAILLIPNPHTLASDALDIQATLTDQTRQSRDLIIEHEQDAWQIKLPAPAAEDRWIVNFRVRGKTPEGVPMDIPVKPLALTADLPGPAAEQSPSPEPATANAGWGLAAGIVAAVNVLVLVAAYLIYLLIKKRRAAAIALLLDKLQS